MIRLLMAAILCAGLAAGSASGGEPKSELASIQGSWKGPWYRGMTSGIMVLQVAKEGSTVTFTNLETFGDAPAPLRQLEFDGKVISFRTSGTSAQELEASLNLSSGNSRLKGFGKYEGFKVRMELEKQP
jgi:hypothetical protein